MYMLSERSEHMNTIKKQIIKMNKAPFAGPAEIIEYLGRYTHPDQREIMNTNKKQII
jgi:hypothetical protein